MATSIYRSITLGIFGLIGLTSLGVVSPSHAASISNGGFDGDFTDWTTIGDTSIETAEFGSGPIEGAYQALVTNTGSASATDVETFLGLETGSLFALGNGNATNGSAIKQTFTAKTGDVVSFSWNFLKEQEPDPIYNDFAFASLNSLSTLASPLTSSLVAFSAPNSTFNQQTGFQASSFTIQTAGTYTLGLGVVNVTDTSGNSGLLVDDVSVKPVPEPSSVLGTLALGAVGVWFLLKRKQQCFR